tara:strand:- start:1205 stop:1318 length:114 start_codon:yes stop_codon:yes gene_type:complete
MKMAQLEILSKIIVSTGIIVSIATLGAHIIYFNIFEK